MREKQEWFATRAHASTAAVYFPSSLSPSASTVYHPCCLLPILSHFFHLLAPSSAQSCLFSASLSLFLSYCSHALLSLFTLCSPAAAASVSCLSHSPSGPASDLLALSSPSRAYTRTHIEHGLSFCLSLSKGAVAERPYVRVRVSRVCFRSAALNRAVLCGRVCVCVAHAGCAALDDANERMWRRQRQLRSHRLLPLNPCKQTRTHAPALLSHEPGLSLFLWLPHAFLLSLHLCTVAFPHAPPSLTTAISVLERRAACGRSRLARLLSQVPLKSHLGNSSNAVATAAKPCVKVRKRKRDGESSTSDTRDE